MWGPLVKRSVCRLCVCWCRRVQLCTDTGAGVYVCAGPGVCMCVHVCVKVVGVHRCVQAQVCTCVQVKRVGTCGHVHKRSCSCLLLQSSLASSLWGVWFFHPSS